MACTAWEKKKIQFFVLVMQNDCQVELYLEHTLHTTADRECASIDDHAPLLV